MSLENDYRPRGNDKSRCNAMRRNRFLSFRPFFLEHWKSVSREWFLDIRLLPRSLASERRRRQWNRVNCQLSGSASRSHCRKRAKRRLQTRRLINELKESDDRSEFSANVCIGGVTTLRRSDWLRVHCVWVDAYSCRRKLKRMRSAVRNKSTEKNFIFIEYESFDVNWNRGS